MSETSSGCYSLGESSGYSYNDLVAYQFSDDDDDAVPRQENTGVMATSTIPNNASNNRCGPLLCGDGEEEEGGEIYEQERTDEEDDALWNTNALVEDNGSYVMHANSSDGDDDLELYQFSDEDLIPEEPDEDWIVAALLSNRWDYDSLELTLRELEDFPRLIEAIYANQVVKRVTIYESFFDTIPTNEEKTILAEAICNMESLESLKVYFHSSFFVGPLQRIRPPNLKGLCLMFFPGRPTKEMLSTLTEFLGEAGTTSTNSSSSNVLENGETVEDPNSTAENAEPNSIHEDGDADIHHDEMIDDAITTAYRPLIEDTSTPPPPLQLESLSVRCELMDDDFIHAIASGMVSNETITTLSFWGNNVKVTEKGNRASAKIDFYLRLNQSGIRDYHLLVNATPSEFLDKITEERENTNVVFYLLESNPDFLSYYSDKGV